MNVDGGGGGAEDARRWLSHPFLVTPPSNIPPLKTENPQVEFLTLEE